MEIENSIQGNAVSKSFHAVKALDHVNFIVPRGTLYGMIGADGAGKTTLLRILVHLISQDQGTISVFGFCPEKDSESILSWIGYMPQKFSLYPDLSVEENIRFFARLYKVPRPEMEKRLSFLLSFTGLESFRTRMAKNLSGGMKQKLTLASLLIHRPSLLVLDEPTVGVDPASRREFWRMLAQLRKEGVTIIASTPYMAEAELCDEILILHHGKVLSSGNPKSLMETYPLFLFQVFRQDGAALRVPPELRAHECGHWIYPKGGMMQVANCTDAPPEDSLLQQIRAIAGGDVQYERAHPDMDDLLLWLIQKNP